MAIFEDIRRMQQEGKSEQDVSILLQEQGYGIKEISESIAQVKIKEAVTSSQDPAYLQSSYGNEQMQPSMSTQAVQEIPQEEQQQDNQPQMSQTMQNSPDQQYSGNQYDYPVQGQQQQQQYQSYDSSYSNLDTMTEIAEQVMAEKLSSLRKQFESIIDSKTSVDARVISLDERLKRIEKVIDRLQLSILQKVGEYVTNVEDIKKEMIETQKSFKSMSGNKHHNQQHHPNNSNN